jgi:prepilin signal peptidase PulO-like enzyme (type II secretory pathway)
MKNGNASDLKSDLNNAVSLVFVKQFEVHKKIQQKTQKLPIHCGLCRFTISPASNITLLTIVFLLTGAKLTYHNYSKIIVYIRVHSGCCTFYVFGQIYN